MSAVHAYARVSDDFAAKRAETERLIERAGPPCQAQTCRLEASVLVDSASHRAAGTLLIETP
jgi:hypothetical protein